MSTDIKRACWLIYKCYRMIIGIKSVVIFWLMPRKRTICLNHKDSVPVVVTADGQTKCPSKAGHWSSTHAWSALLLEHCRVLFQHKKSFRINGWAKLGKPNYNTVQFSTEKKSEYRNKCRHMPTVWLKQLRHSVMILSMCAVGLKWIMLP